jgi:hypothetical protein
MSEEGEMGRWGDGETERRRDGETEREPRMARMHTDIIAMAALL